MICAIRYEGELVGIAGLNAIDHYLRKVQMGYWLHESSQTKGIITRIRQKLIHQALNDLGMEKIEIHASKGNVKGGTVCEQLGFTLEGIISNAENVGDRIVDHSVYGLRNSINN